jgi:hypothetical protein
MRRTAVLSGLALMLLPVAAASAEPAQEKQETVTIPLDKIWAYEMPGTQDVRKLQQHKLAPSMVEQIRQILDDSIDGEEARSAFAVSASGYAALNAAYRVLAKDQKPKCRLSPRKDVTVVFFSRSSSRYVVLTRVEVIDSTVKVHYKMVPHLTKEMTVHFALIPLGELRSGEYHVEIIRQPIDNRVVEAGINPASDAYVRRVVCSSFAFEITK